MRLILVRRDDLLIAGCELTGCDVVPGAPGVPPTAVAGPGGAKLILTLPPQHIAEQLQEVSSATAPAGGVWQAVLSGTSTVAVDLMRSEAVALTIDGLLSAAARALHRANVEMPWRLVISPASSGPEAPLVVHRRDPLNHDGVTAMWRTAIRSQSTLVLVPADPNAAAAPDPPFTIALGRTARMRLVAEAAVTPAEADRLELSALGGWLHGCGAWPAFSWDQRIEQGRDVRVRTATQGTLFPFGHRATFTEFVERVVERLDDVGDAAVLRVTRQLVVDQPTLLMSADAAVRRTFPFDSVELVTTRVDNLSEPVWLPAGATSYFRPVALGPDAALVSFSARFQAADQPFVTVRVPLLFVADPLVGTFDAADGALTTLAQAYGSAPSPVAGEVVDLVRSAAPKAGDRHELRAVTIIASTAAGVVAPSLGSVTVGLPSLRTVLGKDVVSRATYAAGYLERGDAADVVLDLEQRVDIDFVGNSARSGGLVAPRYAATALSRVAGPVNAQAVLGVPAGGSISPSALFPQAATLLGFQLRDLVKDLKLPPQIVPGLGADGRPVVTMAWTDVALRSNGCFAARPSSRLRLTAVAGADGTHTRCSVTDIGLTLPPGEHAVLELTFDAIRFEQHDGHLPEVAIDGIGARFVGDLRLLQDLEDAVNLSALAPYFDVTPAGVVAHYSFPIPEFAVGAFVLRDAVFSARLEVPFDGRPVELDLGFASRKNPFALTVLMFGGGGYVEFAITHEGLTRFEIALEFGALVQISLVVASAEVHALGGVRFALGADGLVELTGYLRIGGSVDILGLVSVSVELCVQLSYRSETNALVGRATLEIDVDLTLWSTSVELDTGDWVIPGSAAVATRALTEFAEFAEVGLLDGSAVADTFRSLPQEAFRRPLSPDEGIARWREYRRAFAGERS
jgi:hypothetical protein